MPGQKKPKLDRPMKKDIARYYARMMYDDDQHTFQQEQEEYKKKLVEQSLENIKERVFHTCPYCNERQEFKGEGHREQTINGKFYWIQDCPSCRNEVYLNLFTIKFIENGQVDYMVDSRWMRKDDVFKIQHVEMQPKRHVLGFGIIKKD